MNTVIARRLLEAVGAIVDTAPDGQQALDLFTSSAVGSYDALLMDIRMPVMDGLTATRAIRDLDRADAKKVPIIAMSANAFDEDITKSLEAGMTAHLAKPVVPETMYDCLRKAIAQSTARGHAKS